MRPYIAKSAGACPCCERPIEVGFVLACRRCFNLFPKGDRQQLRLMFFHKHDYAALLKKCVAMTRERFPATRPSNLRQKSGLGPSALPTAADVARIAID